MMNDTIISEAVKEYYGKILQKSSDLKTNACCTAEKYPSYILDKLKKYIQMSYLVIMGVD